MQYILLSTGLLLALFGALTKNTVDYEVQWRRKITKTGWMVLMLIVVSFIMSILNTAKTERNTERDKTVLAERLRTTQTLLAEQRIVSLVSLFEHWRSRGDYILQFHFPKRKDDDSALMHTDITWYEPSVKSLGISVDNGEAIPPTLLTLEPIPDRGDSDGDGFIDLSYFDSKGISTYELDGFVDYYIPVHRFSNLHEALYRISRTGRDLLTFTYKTQPSKSDLSRLRSFLADSSRCVIDIRVPVELVSNNSSDKGENPDRGREGTSNWRLRAPLEVSELRHEGENVKVSFIVTHPTVEPDYEAEPGP